MNDIKITVGIPAYKAKNHIMDCLSSIQIQSIRDNVKVIIASDEPNISYEYLKKFFPKLDITTLSCKENTGAGLARQRCLDACKTDWITFIDADDVFIDPFALENLVNTIDSAEVVEVQGVFMQEVDDHPQVRMIPHEDIEHPWVFGRLYNVKFLKANKIEFTELRAMEDGCFNWMIRMTVEGSRFRINVLQTPVYLWRIGSEHSITRIGKDEDEDNIPQYNYDLCPLGATIAAIRAAKFCKERNPFNGSIDRFITEMMVDKYFTYIECLDKKEIFAEQNYFNAKRFYHECYKEIEDKISEKVLSDIYTILRSQKAKDLIGIIPKVSFFEFMDKIKNEEYGGEEELIKIREKLPKEIIENDIKTGVAIF